jgi:hypothetical protein
VKPAIPNGPGDHRPEDQQQQPNYDGGLKHELRVVSALQLRNMNHVLAGNMMLDVLSALSGLMDQAIEASNCLGHSR